MNTTSDASPPPPAQPARTALPALYQHAGPILLAGLALGIAGDYLVRENPFGPGFVLWLTLLAGAALWLARAGGQARLVTLATWSATALAAALLLMWRDLDVLVPALFLVILLSGLLILLDTGGVSLRSARIRDQILALLQLPVALASFAPRLVGSIELQTFTRHPRVPGILHGLIIALPLLAVFIALFASADAAFSRYAQSLTKLFSPDTVRHVSVSLVLGWLTAGLLALACRKPRGNEPGMRALVNLGTVEASVVLGLVTALFGLFVLLQLGYLFGGSAVIESTSGLTLAEYARRGFFELLVVAGLTLALLLACSATHCDRRVLSRFGTLLVACVLIILGSAAQRLYLYMDAFGLTLARFNAVAVMVWQAYNLVAFAATVLRGRSAGFATSLAVSGIIALLLLALANPAAMVARLNLQRAADDPDTLDIHYLLDLGADAVPVVLAHFATLPAALQCEIALHLLDRFPVAADGGWVAHADWRTWNASRVAAFTAVAADHERLQAFAARARLALLADPQLNMAHEGQAQITIRRC